MSRNLSRDLNFDRFVHNESVKNKARKITLKINDI